jgi:hypothetical protein
MFCSVCGKDIADEFKFCPHCGKPIARLSKDVEMPISSADPSPLPDVPNIGLTSTPIVSTGSGIQAGTIVFASFAAISLLVSLVKGLVPIYLLEAFGWAGLAWYWQSKKTHSDVAKAIVGTLAVMVVLGEVVHIAMQWDAQPATAPVANSAPVYPGTNPNADANGYPIVGSANTPSTPATPPPGFVVDASAQSAPQSKHTTSADSALPGAAPQVTLAECPSSLPSGATARPLPKYTTDLLVGKQYGDLTSEHTFNPDGDDYLSWSLDLNFTNNANTCIVMAIIEVELSYKGRISKETHTVPFSPLLGPHNEQDFSTVKLNLRTSERGEKPALVGWRTIADSGFEMQNGSAPNLPH